MWTFNDWNLLNVDLDKVNENQLDSGLNTDPRFWTWWMKKEALMNIIRQRQKNWLGLKNIVVSGNMNKNRVGRSVFLPWCL